MLPDKEIKLPQELLAFIDARESQDEVLNRAAHAMYAAISKGGGDVSYSPSDEICDYDREAVLEVLRVFADAAEHPDGCECGGFDRNGSHSAGEYVGYCAKPKQIVQSFTPYREEYIWSCKSCPAKGVAISDDEAIRAALIHRVESDHW